MGALLLTSDLACSSKVTAAAQRSGRPLQVAMSEAALCDKAAAQPAELVILDLTMPGLDPRQLLARLRALAAPPALVLAFGPHVHESKLAAASEAGCEIVMTRGQFHAQIDDLLARHVPAA
jgi:DNA-binding response OmpR family regulator